MKVEEIPLPPAELWAALDNGASTAEAPATSAPAAEPEAEREQIADVLDFVDQGHKRVITLKHPFRLNGQVVSSITVRRLLMGEVDNVVKKSAKGGMTTFDIYAEMTGFKASVLRGLIDEDGDAVVDAAYDFLPRMLRQDSASSES
ncbi:hypothetical protein [Rhizobium sp. CECT 9324]|uniref:hypothetical protein n=1 Tax=Rhizobium sp. CECT 9324 TaxID=2845820 RepID=UPI001E31ABC5|nr:hypothetical protein [Rhizobium sp. CECT 9324]